MKIQSLFLSLVIITASIAQNNTPVVANVGSSSISVNDFKSRYELMPHLSENRNPDSLKKEFLYSLIGEKLWALDALAKGYDTLEYFRDSYKPLQKMYLKDALFQSEIKSKVKISPDEIAKGIFRSRITLKCSIFPFQDSTAAYKLYSAVQKSKNIDSVFSANKLNTENTQEITYGKLDEPQLEDMVYSLKPGEMSKPVKSKGNWFIFLLKDKNVSTAQNDEALNSRVTALLQEKKSREIGMPYLRSLFSGIKSEVNRALFDTLISSVEREISNRPADDYEKEQGVVYLNDNSVAEMMKEFSSILSTSLFNYNNNPVSLKDFLFYLKFDIMKLTKTSRNDIGFNLKRKIDAYIEQDILVSEAVNKGLDKHDDLLKELNSWKESYLSQMLRNDFLKSASVSDDEVYQYYLSKLNKIDTVAQVNFLEILTDKLEVIELVLNELNKGKDFKELASMYTQREWTKTKGGEFGLTPVTLYKELTSAAVNLKPGEVYGPIRTEEGYSIIKLIDKKEAVRTYKESFENVKQQMRTDLVASKLKTTFEDETANLSNKYSVKVNWSNFDKLKLSHIQMFTYRYMGFGGRIAAVPYTTPWYNWIKKNKIIF